MIVDSARSKASYQVHAGSHQNTGDIIFILNKCLHFIEVKFENSFRKLEHSTH